MDATRIAESGRAFEILSRGTIAERRRLVARLDAGDAALDRPQLRRWILEAVEGDYSPATIPMYGRAQRLDRDSPARTKAEARCWMISTLGRIADEDAEAGAYVRRCTLVEHDPYDWARYWALEGLVVSRAPDLAKVAAACGDDPAPLVSRLAQAIVAERGRDARAIETLREGLRGRDWAVLRALRVVPIEELVTELAAVAAADDFDDARFDAIVALGAVPPDWPAAERAADTLMGAVKDASRHPWWDGLRREALAALGRLRSRSAMPLLIDQLSDGNPAIVYEAARALEAALGTETAVTRVVEVAAGIGEGGVTQYGHALRWMQRGKVVEELEALMVSGASALRHTAQALLSEVGGSEAFEKLRARADAMRQHREVLEATEKGLRDLFDESLHEARSGYRLATLMDTTVFLLGVAAVVLSGMLVYEGRETLAALTGAGGSLAILYNLFLGGPRRRVQEAVEHLLSLKVIFLGYLRQLHQADQAYVRRFLEPDALTPAIVREYSDLVSATMRDAITHIRIGARARDRKEPALAAADSGPAAGSERRRAGGSEGGRAAGVESDRAAGSDGAADGVHAAGSEGVVPEDVLGRAQAGAAAVT